MTRVGVDANGKNLTELLDTRLDDRFAVLEGFAGIAVDAKDARTRLDKFSRASGDRLKHMSVGCRVLLDCW